LARPFRRIIISGSVLLACSLSAAQGRLASAEGLVFTAECPDPVGAQTFFIEERIADGRHTGLQVAKADFAPQGSIARLMVFSAVPGGIDEADTYVGSDLTLTFSSKADQYLLIRKASISLATEGETGPVIEDFRLHHDNGQILQVIEEANPVHCTEDGANAETVPQENVR
jgi:hypothetical protein